MCILDLNGFPTISKCNIQKLLQSPFTSLPPSTQFQIFRTGRPKPSLPDLHITTKSSIGTILDEVLIDKSFYDKTNWITGCSTTKKLYCWPCLLFRKKLNKSQSMWTTTGFSDHSNSISFRKQVDLHREQHEHLQSLLAYLNFDKKHPEVKKIQLSSSHCSQELQNVTQSNREVPECVTVDDDDDIQVSYSSIDNRPQVTPVREKPQSKSSTPVVLKKNTCISKQHPSKNKKYTHSKNNTSKLLDSNSEISPISQNKAAPSSQPKSSSSVSTKTNTGSTSKQQPSSNIQTPVNSTTETSKSTEKYSSYQAQETSTIEQDSIKIQTPVSSNNKTSNLKSNKKSNGGFTCEVCDRSFKLLSHLTLHAKKHPQDKVHTCTACSKSYNDSKLLSKHIKTVHQGTNIGVVKQLLYTEHLTYTCSFCEFSGSSCTTNKLLQHFKTIHQVEKPFKCRFCNIKFDNLMKCKEHLKTLHNAKLYTCNFCSCTFDGILKLESHMLQLHTKKRNYECKICKKKFVHEKYYEEHLKAHKAVQELESAESCTDNKDDIEVVSRDKVSSNTESEENVTEVIFGRCAGIPIIMTTKITEVYKVGDSIINYNDEKNSDIEDEDELQSNPTTDDECDNQTTPEDIQPVQCISKNTASVSEVEGNENSKQSVEESRNEECDIPASTTVSVVKNTVKEIVPTIQGDIASKQTLSDKKERRQAESSIDIQSKRIPSRNEDVQEADEMIEEIIDLGNGKRIIVPVAKQSRAKENTSEEPPSSDCSNEMLSVVRPCSIQLDRAEVMQYFEEARDAGKELTFQLTDLFPQLSLECQVVLDRNEVTKHLDLAQRSSSDQHETEMNVSDDDSDRPSPCPSMDVLMQDDNSSTWEVEQDKSQSSSVPVTLVNPPTNIKDSASVVSIQSSTDRLQSENVVSRKRKVEVDSPVPTKVTITDYPSDLEDISVNTALTPTPVQPSTISPTDVDRESVLSNKEVVGSSIVEDAQQINQISTSEITNQKDLVPIKLVKTLQFQPTPSSILAESSIPNKPQLPTESLDNPSIGPILPQLSTTGQISNTTTLPTISPLPTTTFRPVIAPLPSTQLPLNIIPEKPVGQVLSLSLATCTECGNLCLNESDLKIHKAMHTFSNSFSKPYCEICKLSYVNTCSFNIHQHLHHKNELFTNKPVVKVKGYILHKCHLCLSVFIDEKLFYIHCHPYVCYSQLALYCTISNKNFESKEIFEAHAKTHDNCMICKICSQKFNNYTKLTAHVQIEHNVNTIYCSKCQTDIVASTFLSRHLNECTGESSETMLCSCCPTSSTDQQLMITHVQEKHSGKLTYDFICKCCLKSFPTIENFKCHKKNIHPFLPEHDYDYYKVEPIKNSSEHQMFVLSKSEIPKNKLYAVSIGKGSESVYQFKSPNTIKYFTIQNVVVKNHLKPDKLTTMFTCKICKIRMVNVNGSQVETHLDSHNIVSGYNYLPCLYCGFICKTTIDLEIHIEIHHHTCKICHQMLHNKPNYMKHEVEHSKGLCHVLTCICGIDFKLLDQFQNHIMKHHKADACEGKTIVVYKKPVRQTRFNYEIQSPQCPYCNKYFASDEYLKIHMTKIHSVYTCRSCKKFYLKHYYEMINSYFIESSVVCKVQFEGVFFEPTNTHCAKCQYLKIKVSESKSSGIEIVDLESQSNDNDSGQGSEVPEMSAKQNTTSQEKPRSYSPVFFEDYKIEIVENPVKSEG